MPRASRTPVKPRTWSGVLLEVDGRCDFVGNTLLIHGAKRATSQTGEPKR